MMAQSSRGPGGHDVVTLVGLMGAGKSTVARLLAARWPGWRALDLDAAVEADAGQAIPTIFARLGEARFRELEAAALVRALATPRTLLATGGGAPCEPGAMDRILAAGPAVWLDAPDAVLAARALSQGGRPLLAGMDLAAATRYLAGQRGARGPHFARATLTVDASAAPEAVAAAIAAQLEGSP